MNDILIKIIEQKRIEIEQHKAQVSEQALRASVEHVIRTGNRAPSLRSALEESPTGIIAEFKRKSPSLGWINKDASPENIPVLYQENGATALSILTDEPFFGGCLDFIRIARPKVNIPILRKDFILDEYQLLEACEVGASAVLLIAACLSVEECSYLANKAKNLQLEVLLEIHRKEELDHITEDTTIVGVNNRNLSTFQTDINTSYELAKLIPSQYLKVSESGLGKPEDLINLRKEGYRGFLMGERFMKKSNPGEELKNFIRQLS